jgi:hypothetical protein
MYNYIKEYRALEVKLHAIFGSEVTNGVTRDWMNTDHQECKSVPGHNHPSFGNPRQKHFTPYWCHGKKSHGWWG